MLFYIYLQIYIIIYLIIYRAVFRGVHPWSLFVVCLDHPVSTEAYIRPDSREGADGGASARRAVLRPKRSFRVETTNTITLIISYLVFDFRIYLYIIR